MKKRDFDYDVALSFAGEDRNYVNKVAQYLSSHDMKIFYDRYELLNTWGKNMFEHLREVYRNKARYCVIFISKYYKQKAWPTHELRSAQERTLHEIDEYILPARFDDTELPGLPITTSYIDLREINPEEFAKMIIQKISGINTQITGINKPKFRVPHVRPRNFNQYEEAIHFKSFLQEELDDRSKVLQDVNASLSIYENAGKTCFRVVDVTPFFVPLIMLVQLVGIVKAEKRL